MTTESLRILLRDLITMRKRLSVERSCRNEDKAYTAIVVASDALQDEIEARSISSLDQFNRDRALARILNPKENHNEPL